MVTTILLLVSAINAARAETAGCLQLDSLRNQAITAPTAFDAQAYLAKFPHSFRMYKAIFDRGYFEGDSRGCSVTAERTVDHLTLLKSILQKHPRDVIRLELEIAVGAVYEADAVGYLQKRIAEDAAANTAIFAEELEKRSRAELVSIVEFLADVEAPNSYPEYIAILKNLRNLNRQALVDEFELAREVRKLKYDH